MQILQTESNSRRVIANVILLAMLVFNNARLTEVSFPLAIIYCIVMLRDRDFGVALPSRLLLALAPLLLLVVLGLPGSFAHANYDVGKDVWYFMHPVAAISFGYFWFRESGHLGDLIDCYSVGGVISAVVSAGTIYANWGKILLTGSLDQYRQLAGTGSLIGITAFTLILLAQSRGFKDSVVLRKPWLKRTVIVISLVATAISFSRVLIGCAAAGYLVSLSKEKLVKRLALFAVLAIPLSAATQYLAPGNYGDSFLSQFVLKIKNSASEVSVQHHFQSSQDISENYRGYEAERGLKAFDSFDSLHQVIGGGFGQLVDLGIEFKAYEYDFVRIGILHNGYIYLLVKTGYLGEALFALFLGCCLIPFWQTRGADRRSLESILGVIVLWAVLVVVFTQGVITGIYAKNDYDCITYLVGACFAGTASLSYRWTSAAAQRVPVFEEA